MTAAAASALAQKLRAHYTGIGSLVNTIWATHGVNSPAGRVVDDSRFRNPGAVIDALVGEAALDVDPEPTDAAAQMNAHGILRTSGRRIAMPKTAHAAVVAYVDELVALLERARKLVPESRVIAWHDKQTRRLRDAVATRAPA